VFTAKLGRGECRGRAAVGGANAGQRLALPAPKPDGPFVEVKELVGGYMVISAARLDGAVQLARECLGSYERAPASK
jgi:hypothetical protein